MSTSVSIIVAAHNRENTLRDTLDSIIAQTHRDWETLIIDDGSSDATEEIANTYADRDSRFKVISQANSGVSAARNTGIELAQFDWLLFLDADDWIEPTHLEQMTVVLERDPSLDAAWCGWAYITADGYQVFGEDAVRHATGEPADLFPMHANGCPMAIHAFLVGKRLVQSVGGFDPELIVGEDWDLWQKVSRTGARYGACAGMLAPYRMRSDSASMDGQRILHDGLKVLEQGHKPDPLVSAQRPNRNGLPANELLLKKYYLACAAAGLMIGKNLDARGLLDRSLMDPASSLHPFTVADCVVVAAMTSAAQPLTEWQQTWRAVEPRWLDFLEALEKLSTRPGLARRAKNLPRYLITTYMRPISGTHRARAMAAKLMLLPAQVESGIKSRLAGHKYGLKRRVRTFLRLFPKTFQRLKDIKRSVDPHYDRELFEELFEDEDPWQYTSDYEQKKYEQTLEMVPAGKIDDALEIACAEGHFTRQLAPRVEHLIATDLTQLGIDHAALRCKEHSNIQFQRFDLQSDELTGSFDLIVCSEVLYFVNGRKRLAKVAQKFADALKPDGTLIMAHGNIVLDDPTSAGFDWVHSFGAKGIGEVFAANPELNLDKEIRTPIYRVQRFRKQVGGRDVVPEIIQMEQPTELTPLVNDQVLWHGATDKLPILMYHRIAVEGSDELKSYRVAPEEFELQLRWLADSGFVNATFEDWKGWIDHREPLPRKSVLITFDDGYRDFYESAWPLLDQYGFSATVFLVAGKIGQHNRWDIEEFGEKVPLMDWRQIRELQNAGITFGSHSVTHKDLVTLSWRQAVSEMYRSKSDLEVGLGETVHYFAYPFGSTNVAMELFAGLCAYEFGLTCNDGVCTVNSRPLALPRIEIEGTDTLDNFSEKLNAATNSR